MSIRLPQNACDAHCHVFGPPSHFPYDPQRPYTPDTAPKEQLMALHQRLGLDRAVIVQPACHGLDNSVTLDAIAASGGAYRGVALVGDDVDADHIAALHDGGIRGVRFNFVSHLGAPPSQIAFERIAELIAPFDWHVVLHLDAGDLKTVAPYLGPLHVPFVIDHMARINTAEGLDQEPFKRLLDLVSDPRAWIKISGADRVSADGAPYHDVIAFAQQLAAAAPTRTLWGSDWPHPNVKGPIPSEEVLLDLLWRIVPDTAAQRKILVENPDRLYRFEAL